MNNKEVEKVICEFCESRYKLVYDPTETSGYDKFCPFCGEVREDEEINTIKDDDNREE